MKLLRPAAFRVELAEKHHQERSELAVFLRRNRFAIPRLVENAGGNFFGAKIREAMNQAVVGQPAALGMEKIMAFFECAFKCTKAVDVDVRGGGKLFHPPVETGGLVCRQRRSGRNAGNIFVGWPWDANAR